jgi:putative FmdB family regulatory protein
MPIYEYRCQSCDHELEVMQKLSDPELNDCPACGEPELKKLISPVGFRLKGSGWYETDFKQGHQKNVAKDDAPATTDSKPSASCDGAGGCGACATPAAAT